MYVGFNLGGVRNGQFGIVADRVVNFAGSFPTVLRLVRSVLEIVIAVGGAGQDVREGVIRQQAVLSVGCAASNIGIILGGKNRLAIGASRACGQSERNVVGVSVVRIILQGLQKRRSLATHHAGLTIDCVFTEVAGPLFHCGHVVVDRGDGGMLVHVLIANPEKELLAVFVEIREGQNDGAANVAAGIVEMSWRLERTGELIPLGR